MDKVQPILALAFRAVALALAAVSLVLVALGIITAAIISLAVGLCAVTLAGFIPKDSKRGKGTCVTDGFLC